MRETFFDLDDASLKRRLQTFIGAQTEFTSYDFEASNLSQLLDILVVITKQLVFQNNMTLTELFLETAQLRKCVVAAAKRMGYLPNRYLSAVGNLTATDPNAAGGNALAVSNGTNFTIGGKSYYSTSAVAFTSAAAWSSATNYTLGQVVSYGGSYYKCLAASLNNQPDLALNAVYWEITENGLQTLIPVIEGTISTVVYNYLSSNVTELAGAISKIALPYNYEVASNAVLMVEVSLGGGAYAEWFNVLTLDMAITTTSQVYWFKEIDGVLYICFGDDVTGASVPYSATNNVRITYTISSGTAGDVVKGASISPAAISGFDITLENSIENGRYQETINELKINAPLFYNAANRCIISDDYTANLINAGIYDISVWGGESEVFTVADTEWMPLYYPGALVNYPYVAGAEVNVLNKAIYRCVADCTLTLLSDIWGALSTSWVKIGHIDLGKVYMSGLRSGLIYNRYYTKAQYDDMWNNVIGKKHQLSFERAYVDPVEAFIYQTINVYYKNINFVNSTYNAQVLAFAIKLFDDNFVGFNKKFYSGRVASEIINEFSVVNNVTTVTTLQLRIRRRPEYNPQCSGVYKIYKRLFCEVVSATMDGAVTEYALSGDDIIDTSTSSVIGTIDKTHGIIEIYDYTTLVGKTQDININFVLKNSDEIVGQRELYLDRGVLTINGIV